MKVKFLDLMDRVIAVRDALDEEIESASSSLKQELKDASMLASHCAARLEMAAWKNGEIKDGTEAR